MLPQLVLYLTAAAAALMVTASAQLVSIPVGVALLTDPEGSGVKGNITFTLQPNGTVHVYGIIFGMPSGYYGFHVHEKGDLTGGCSTLGGHYNPEDKKHGGQKDEERHVGDLGNVKFGEHKSAKVDLEDSKLDLIGPNSIIGRGLVLHKHKDDLGREDNAESKKNGNSGPRIACGIIGIK